jgi:hypothetical protein
MIYRHYELERRAYKAFDIEAEGYTDATEGYTDTEVAVITARILHDIETLCSARR